MAGGFIKRSLDEFKRVSNIGELSIPAPPRSSVQLLTVPSSAQA
jgi:hypothetical protein